MQAETQRKISEFFASYKSVPDLQSTCPSLDSLVESVTRPESATSVLKHANNCSHCEKVVNMLNAAKQLKGKGANELLAAGKAGANWGASMSRERQAIVPGKRKAPGIFDFKALLSPAGIGLGGAAAAVAVCVLVIGGLFYQRLNSQDSTTHLATLNFKGNKVEYLKEMIASATVDARDPYASEETNALHRKEIYELARGLPGLDRQQTQEIGKALAAYEREMSDNPKVRNSGIPQMSPFGDPQQRNTELVRDALIALAPSVVRIEKKKQEKNTSEAQNQPAPAEGAAAVELAAQQIEILPKESSGEAREFVVRDLIPNREPDKTARLTSAMQELGTKWKCSVQFDAGAKSWTFKSFR